MQRRARTSRVLAAFAALLAFTAVGVPGASAAPPAPIPVTGCGTIVPANTTGIVQNDFNCTAVPSVARYYGIVLNRNSVLDLNGHTITLVQDEQTIAVVNCEKNCEVRGPGTITNVAEGGGAGIISFRRARITARDVTLSRLTVGIETTGNVNATNVSIQAQHYGIALARKVVVDHVDVTLPANGQEGECVGASQSGGSVDGNDVTVTGCQHGVYGTIRVKIVRLNVTNSYIGAFSGGTMTLTDSSVTGSARVDLLSRKRPALVNTTCGSSEKVQSTGTATWGVCAND